MQFQIVSSLLFTHACNHAVLHPFWLKFGVPYQSAFDRHCAKFVLGLLLHQNKMQVVAIFVSFALLSQVQANHHCCKCCTQEENTCAGHYGSICKYGPEDNEQLLVCNDAAAMNAPLFMPLCFEASEVLAAKSEGFKATPVDWFSKPISHAEAFVGMFFMTSMLAIGFSYVRSRSRNSIVDPAPLLA